MVGIIPKAIKKAPEWHNLAFYISLGLLTAVILGYVLFFYFESKALNSLQDLEGKISQLNPKGEKNIENKVLITKEQIDTFAELLDKHKKPSKFFAFLEENTHPKIWFSEVELNPEKAGALINGQAASFEVLGQQLLIFQQHESIKSVDTTNILIDKEGKAGFSFYLYLDPQILK